MSEIKNCYTCGHVMERNRPTFMKCALNGGEYCEIITQFHANRCSWVPREPTLWEVISSKLKDLLK